MGEVSGIWADCLDCAALSDIGLRRANNQDAYAVALAADQADFDQRGHFFMVADGMGAHAAGELASKIATDVVSLSYRKLLDQSPPEALRAAVLDANRQIHARGEASGDFRGMGTTATVLVLLPAGGLVAHVGDSRAYRLRGRQIEQLTFDHSLVWEIQASGQLADRDLANYISKNIITRSLGPDPGGAGRFGRAVSGPGRATPSCCAATGFPNQVPTTRSAWCWAACRRPKPPAR